MIARPSPRNTTAPTVSVARVGVQLGGKVFSSLAGERVLLGGAGALLYRGWTGHCALYQTMELSSASQDASPVSTRSVTGPDETPLVVLAGA